MQWLGCRGRTRLPPTNRRTEARAAVTGTQARWIGSPPGIVDSPAANAPVGPESLCSENWSCCGIRGRSRDTRGRTSERGGTRLEQARVLLVVGAAPPRREVAVDGDHRAVGGAAQPDEHAGCRSLMLHDAHPDPPGLPLDQFDRPGAHSRANHVGREASGWSAQHAIHAGTIQAPGVSRSTRCTPAGLEAAT